MKTDFIRNFSIIAHIDHGKSTLADRMLEATQTVEKRKMRAQVLDNMELERERGITIKMQPVRMHYLVPGGQEYTLNLIDTPGHIDFGYEVSRALTAVEGVLLLVDATQGIQAQTLATLAMARAAGCTVVPVVTKIDMPAARPEEVKQEIAKVLDVAENTILEVSGKTGQGVPELLAAIVERIPPPKTEYAGPGGRALVFDFDYSEHRGVIAYVRIFDGEVRAKDPLIFSATEKKAAALETGILAPEEVPTDGIAAGDIGYVVTGIKEPGIALVGDTLMAGKCTLPGLPGYALPRPVVWASLYPESQDDFTLLKQALLRLKLGDAALSFEEDGSSVLGKGFRCGFLGMLHVEIVTERLKREFNLEPVITAPSIMYEVQEPGGEVERIFTPTQFPESPQPGTVREQWVSLSIITPPEYLSALSQLLYEHEAVVGAADLFGDNRMEVKAEMPLRELMRGFFDKLKSVSSGFASLSYEFEDFRPADVARLDILVADEIVPAFSRIVSRRRLDEEARASVLKLAKTLPRQQFVLKIQAKALGRIVASEHLSALRKDVTGYLYGGDVSRKKKLLEKQKKGKERRGEHAKMNIPQDVFLKMVKPTED
ncbi:MAG: translation elongation factor 4 [Patescibacteria group bacterium]|nr:translation elongation factor 4 [Patescibacteria group bacterium]